MRLQDKLGKQNIQQIIGILFEPVAKTNKDVSEDVTKTLMVSSG